jgi:hypothetical protein
VSYWVYRRLLSETFASSILHLMSFPDGLIGTARKLWALPHMFYLNHALSYKILYSHQAKGEGDS